MDYNVRYGMTEAPRESDLTSACTACDALAKEEAVDGPDTDRENLAQRVRDGRVRTDIGRVAALADAVAAFNPTQRVNGKTIIHGRR